MADSQDPYGIDLDAAFRAGAQSATIDLDAAFQAGAPTQSLAEGLAGEVAGSAVSTVGAMVEGAQSGLAVFAAPMAGTSRSWNYPQTAGERVANAQQLDALGGGAIQEAGAGIAPEARAAAREAHPYLSAAASGLGSTAGFVTGGAVATALGGPVAAGATVAGMGAAAGMSQGWREAKAAGADDATALKQALVYGGVGTSEIIPLGRILGRMFRGVGGRVIKDALLESGSEVGQEIGQQLAQDWAAKNLSDKDRKILANWAETGVGAGATGLILSLLGSGGARIVGGRQEAASQDAADPAPPGGYAPEPGTDAPRVSAELSETVSETVSGEKGPPVPDLASNRPDAPLTPPPLAEPEPAPAAPAQEPAQPPPQAAQPTGTPSQAEAVVGVEAPATEPKLSGEAGAAEPTAAEPVTPPPAAEPPAPDPDLSDLTGIKNAAVDAERAAMGMEPATHGERMEWATAAKEAKATLDRDPEAGRRLIQDLTDNPRAISVEETGILDMELVRAVNEVDAARAELDKARATGEGIEAAEARAKVAGDNYFKASEVGTIVGTKNAQSLAFRKAMFKRDYTLAEMQRVIRDAKGGEALTAAESKQVQELHDKIAATQKAFDEYVASAEFRSAAQQAEIAALSKKQRRERPARKPIQEFLTARADEARARIKKRALEETTFSAGIAAHELADYAIIGAEHIAKGVASFRDWSAAMLAEFGEKIRPHLPEVYRRAVDLNSTAAVDRGRLQGIKTRTANAIEMLRQKIESQDFSKPAPRAPVQLDQEAIRLKAENEALKVQFKRLRQRHELANRTRAQKIKDAALEILDLPRAIWSSYDVSAVFRQGGILTLGTNPKRTARQVRNMFRALASESEARRIDTEIRSRPGYEFGRASGLEITSLDHDIGSQEEAIRSRLSDKIPGIPASNRAFITFLNQQRAEAFDAMVRALPGTPTLEQGKAIAHFVNVATGRSAGKSMAQHMHTLGHFLWSPRLLVSRFQFLLGDPLIRGTPQTRKIIAKQYAKTLIGLSAVYGLSALAGFDLEDDPRSSDFGKIKVGDSRIDPLAGLAQVSVLVSRLATGETKALQSGEIRPIRGEGARETSSDVIGRFLRTKLSPIIGSAIDVAGGRDVVGQPVTLGSEAQSAIVPLSFSSILDAMKSEGIAEGAALGILGLFGMGLQTIEDKQGATAQR